LFYFAIYVVVSLYMHTKLLMHYRSISVKIEYMLPLVFLDIVLSAKHCRRTKLCSAQIVCYSRNETLWKVCELRYLFRLAFALL